MNLRNEQRKLRIYRVQRSFGCRVDESLGCRQILIHLSWCCPLSEVLEGRKNIWKGEMSFSSDEGERLTAGKSCSLCGGGGWSGNTRRTREHFSPQLAPRNLGGVKMERKGRVNHRTNKIYYIYLSFRVWGLSLHFTEYPRQPALPNHLVPDLLLSPLTLPPDFLISRYLDFSFSKSF